MITQVDIILRLLLSIVLGGLVGYEREKHRRYAGFRTHILVSLGSTLVTIVSTYYFFSDPARIAAGIVTGIGFLGAGNIIRAKGHISGLTTAASLWVVAGIGIALGAGAYFLASITAVLVFVVLSYARLK